MQPYKKPSSVEIVYFTGTDGILLRLLTFCQNNCFMFFLKRLTISSQICLIK
jgi:hypothetical protein